MNAGAVIESLQQYARPEAVPLLLRFFQTGPGQYGEGDEFMGARVPQIRHVARQFRGLPLPEIQKLLDSPLHEHRLIAVIVMSMQFPRASEELQRQLYEMYLANTRRGRINNWDIVDVTAKHVVGAYLMDRPRDVLFELARSSNIWERRVAILGSAYFIGKGDPSTTLELAEVLLHDTHDLMHKAVGWMLREVGKRVDRALLTDFLDRHAHEMPRTMLRYAIEHLPQDKKQHYMRLR